MNRMLLSAMPIEEVRKQMPRVRSKLGSVGKVVWVSPEPDREDFTIEIQWDSGRISNAWHFWMDKIEVIEEENQ